MVSALAWPQKMVVPSFPAVVLRAASAWPSKLVESKNVSRVLRTRADFVLLKEKGQKSSPRRWVTFISHENSTGHLRVGFTLSRKVGSAVIRNRLRRWGREFFRQALKEGLQMGVDINVIFRPMEPGFYRKLEHEEYARAFAKGLRMVRDRYSATRAPHD
jgi:ribonuclease P protein component